MDPNSTDRDAFALETFAQGDDETVSSIAFIDNNTAVEVTANNAWISVGAGNILKVSTDPLIAPKDINGFSQITEGGLEIMMPYYDEADNPSKNVKISEIQIAGATETDEFVELYCASSNPCDISNWTLKHYSAQGVETTLASINAGTSITGYGYYLIAHDDYDGPVSADVTYNAAEIAGDNSIILYEGTGQAVDVFGVSEQSLIYEDQAPLQPAPANGSYERRAFYGMTAQEMAFDTNGNGYDTESNTIDFIIRDTADPQNSSSDPEEPSAAPEGEGSSTAPFIDHMPIFNAVAGMELSLMAKIDDQDNAQSQLIKTLYYKKPSDAQWSSVSGYYLADSVYKFTIPAGAVTSEGLYYYLYAADPDGNELYLSNSPVNTQASAEADPFQITVNSTNGSRKISGHVYTFDCSTPISGATVYLEGTGRTVISDSEGAYVFTNVPDGVYNLSAIKTGYSNGWIGGIVVNSNVPEASGWDFCMPLGSVSGGDIERPHIVWYVPEDGMMGAPTTIGLDEAPPLIGFDKIMDCSTVTTSSVEFKEVSGGTAESVQNYSVGCATVQQGVSGTGGQNEFTIDGQTFYAPSNILTLVVLYSNNELETGKEYLIRVTQSVTDWVGNTIPGNRPDGSFVTKWRTTDSAFDFENDLNTIKELFDTVTGKWQGGQYTPPYIMGTIPAPGEWGYALNNKIVISFDQAMDPTSITADYFKVYPITNGQEGTPLTFNSISLDSTNKNVIIDPGTLTANQSYRIKVLSGARGKSGLTLGPPEKLSEVVFMSDFSTTANNDSSGPIIVGSYPDDGETEVPLDLATIEIAFDEPLDISLVNMKNISLKTGTTVIQGSLKYNLMDQVVRFHPSTALSPGVKYVLSISGLKDLAGNEMTAVTRTFTTTNDVPTDKPRLEFANSDEYQMAITFSKAMNAADVTQDKEDSSSDKWDTSVLNPNNYIIQEDCSSLNFCSGSQTMTNVSFSYDPEVQTVYIKGLALPTTGAGNFKVTVTNVTDILGNPIDTTANTFMGPVMSSSNTGGMIGPGGPKGMVGIMDGKAMNMATGFGDFMPDDFVMMGAMVQPMNMMAGATTTYFIDFPIADSDTNANALDDGAQIKITFPIGFDVSNVIPDPYNPDKNDLNMEGPGKWVLKTSGVAADASDAATKGGAANDGVTVSGQTVTIWLSSNGTTSGDPDFFHFELKNIVNSSVPKDFDTSGYTVDMKSVKADGSMAESKSSAPFYLRPAGTNTLQVKVYLDDQNSPDQVNCSNIALMGGSPMTGPLDTTIDFTNGYATHSWNNLPDGFIHIFMDPVISCGGNKYQAQLSPEPINVSGGGTITKTIVLNKLDASTAAALKVTLNASEVFKAGGEDIDIFAGGPFGFAVETDTVDNTFTSKQYILYLPQDGEYSVGIGPAIKGPMMGPPPMPDWMPPRSINVSVSGIGNTVSIKDENGNDVTDTGVTLTIQSANKEIQGRVYSDTNSNGVYDSGEEIVDAEVSAHQPMGFGGMGAYTKTKADGTFILKVAETGVYEVSAFKPGLPDSAVYTVEVKSGTGSNTVFYVNGQQSTGINGDSPFLLKMKKPSYTISGKISDQNDNPVQYAPVWARNTSTGEVTYSGTDSNGNYVLFVDSGTWEIKADMPYGTDMCGTLSKTVTVTNSDLYNQYIYPIETTCYTVSGTVTVGGATQANIPIYLEEWDTANDRPAGGYHRDAMTDNSGAYTFNVTNGTYRVTTWLPQYGELYVLVTVNGANKTADITEANTYTLTIPFTGGTTDMTGTIDVKSSNGKHRHIKIEKGDLSGSNPQIQIDLPADTYTVRAYIEGVGSFSQDEVDLTSGDVIATANNFDLSAITLHTVSGIVKDDTGSPIEDAMVLIQDPATGLRQKAMTESDGTYSLTIKDCTNCEISVSKPNYTSPAKATLTITSDISAYNFDSAISGDDGANNALVANDYLISGLILQSDGSTPMEEGYVWCEKFDGGWTGGEIAGDGTYSFSASNGTWTCKAKGPRHATTDFSSTVIVNGSDVNVPDQTLTADVSKIVKTEIYSVTPSVGGIIDDTNNTGVKLVIPPNALGQSSQPAQVIIKETYTAPETVTTQTLGESNLDIKIRDYEGNSITQFNDDIEYVIHYDESKVTEAGINETNLNLTWYDETVKEYVHVPSIVDTNANTISASLDHLTPISPAGPISISGGTTPSGGGGGLILPPVEEEEEEEVTPEEEAAPEEDVVSEEEIVTEEEISPEVEETPTVEEIKTVAEVPVTIKNAVPVLPSGKERDLAKEKDAIKVFVATFGRGLPETAADWSTVIFLSYGSSEKTKTMTLGDRKGLIQDFKDIYGHLPATDRDWQNVARIAEGITPDRVLSVEAQALKEFIRVFKRLVDFKVSAEESFIHMVAYRLRIIDRDLVKEKAGLKKFITHYGILPSNGHLWAVLRALSYLDIK